MNTELKQYEIAAQLAELNQKLAVFENVQTSSADGLHVDSAGLEKINEY